MTWYTDIDLERGKRENLPDFLTERMQPGHTFAYDPPGGLSQVERWTCIHPDCGGTVLRASGHIYGSGTERACAHVGAEA